MNFKALYGIKRLDPNIGMAISTRNEFDIHLRHKALLAAGWRVELLHSTNQVLCHHPKYGVTSFEQAQEIYLREQKQKPSHSEYDKIGAKLLEKGWKQVPESDKWEHDMLGSMSKEEAYEVANK